MKSANTINLLHLSDIHFKKPLCLNPGRDPDHPVREALKNDVSQRIKKVGPIDAIVVGGDISFQADSEEFDVAAEWLESLAVIAECKEKVILPIPGNHDVQRSVIAANPSTSLIREGLLKREAEKRFEGLVESLKDPQANGHLFAPLDSYNAFAARYACDVSGLDRLSWWYQLQISPQLACRIHGMTSVLFSGPSDRERSLMLGRMQTSFAVADGVINVAVSHHPPEWLIDGDDIDDDLWNRSRLHLFGHKHRNRIRVDDQGIRLFASAVNPARNEGEWEPGYNIVQLSQIEEGGKPRLRIDCHVFIWQRSPDRFVRKKTTENEGTFSRTYSVVLAKIPPVNAAVTSGPRAGDALGGASNEPIESAVGSGVTQSLVKRFWSISASERRQIANSLNVLTEEDLKLQEYERYRRAFLEIKRRGLVAAFEEAVKKAEED